MDLLQVAADWLDGTPCIEIVFISLFISYVDSLRRRLFLLESLFRMVASRFVIMAIWSIEFERLSCGMGSVSLVSVPMCGLINHA